VGAVRACVTAPWGYDGGVRESEPHGGDAGRRYRVGLVADQARGGIRLVQIVQQRRRLKQLLLAQERLQILVGWWLVAHRSALELHPHPADCHSASATGPERSCCSW